MTVGRGADSRSMRAVRFYGPGVEPRIDRLPKPRLWPGQALLKVLAAGVCHTELQLLEGTLNPGVWPITPGHEIVGEVLEVAGEAPGEMAGQRVIVYYSQPCGECEWCQAGQEQVCPNAGPQPGLSADGGFADVVRVPVASLIRLPDALDPVEAAPLGCAAATALHAIHVAQTRSAETVVVYGVGGVGLPLVQLAVLAGARVLAVGRSREKLALAERLGAEAVDASADDPALMVRRLTRGEGAHAVFELVGSDRTMPGALAMLRRQGRLVFVGYGPDRLLLNPLHLVLREIQVLSSLGNTRQELAEVVRLAAEGKLRVPIAAECALEDASGALNALAAGQLTGRAVLVPARASSSVHLPRQWSLTAGQGEPRTPVMSAGPSHPALSPARAQHPPAAAGDQLEDELLRFVAAGVDAPRDDATFNALALRLFAYQYANNRPYQALCDRRGTTPSTVDHWRGIPPVPIAAFKETLLTCEATSGATEFNSSGTTKPERKSRHFHPNLRLYDSNAAANFKAHMLPDLDRLRFAVLFPPRHELPHSSLAHWLSLMVERWGASGSDWYVSQDAGLDAAATVASLRLSESDGQPVGILAASFGLVHFLEHCLEHNVRFKLAPGSRVMDTGGYKGQSREYSKADLYAMVTDVLGVPDSHIVNMYGMTEHGTQFMDTVLRDALAGIQAPRHKSVPRWARTIVVNPETLLETPPGERGLLLHFDLINRNSVMAVLSEDVGYAVGDGFELTGRAQGAEARGCSIALDELIEAVSSR